VVIPEIVASLGFGWVMNHLLNNNRLAAVVAGGVFFMLAALLTQKVEDLDDPHFLRKSAPAGAGEAHLSA
jgi:ABC-type proline/glycine betaine transport system permease subunit